MVNRNFMHFHGSEILGYYVRLSFVLQICSLVSSTAGLVLGDECNGDWECKDGITGSICNRGRCSCQPFYARVNQTHCVQCKNNILKLCKISVFNNLETFN